MKTHLRRAAIVLAAAVTGTLVAATGQATAATLTNGSWAVSNNQVGATGIQYTYNFTTATAGTIASITMTVPAGTGGTPTVAQNVGIGAGNVALSSNTLTYTVTTPVSVAAGIPIELAIGGLTNTSTAGSDTATITTMDNASPAVTIDSVTTPAVSFGATNTAVSVNVAESTSFSTDTTSFTFNMDPSLAALATQSKTVNLTVTSNAGQGYTLNVKDAGLKATSGTSTDQIAAATSGMGTAAAWPSGTHFGYAAATTGTGGSPTLGGTLATSGNYAGFTTTGENVLTTSGPTGNNGVTLALTNKAQIDYTTPAGAYTDTITYTVTPSY